MIKAKIKEAKEAYIYANLECEGEIIDGDMQM